MFTSTRGILPLEIGVTYDTPPTMMHTDPPDHTAYRKLVAPAFRPSVIAAIAERARGRAEAAVGTVEAMARTGEAVDVVEHLSVPLPLGLIADVLGMPDEDLDRLRRWSDAMIPDASSLTDDERNAAMGECFAYLLDQCADRRRTPRDDLVSVLAHTEIDGRQLDDAELVMFLNQLLVAGNETTRNAISGGIDAFVHHPDQWDRLRADPALLAHAVEEILRWTTPVISFLRTATTDVVLGDATVAAGDPVLLLYQSANRDGAQFGPTAADFDIARQPNAHLAFGFGAHFCLGAALARLELATYLRHSRRSSDDDLGRRARVAVAVHHHRRLRIAARPAHLSRLAGPAHRRAGHSDLPLRRGIVRAGAGHASSWSASPGRARRRPARSPPPPCRCRRRERGCRALGRSRSAARCCGRTPRACGG